MEKINRRIDPTPKTASPLHRSLRIAMMLEAAVLVLTALMLDSGATFRACLIIVAAHWAAIFLIFARRRSAPTPLDLAFVRYGFWLLLPAFLLLGRLISRIKGVG